MVENVTIHEWKITKESRGGYTYYKVTGFVNGKPYCQDQAKIKNSFDDMNEFDELKVTYNLGLKQGEETQLPDVITVDKYSNWIDSLNVELLVFLNGDLVNLDENNMCVIFGKENRPKVCSSLKPSLEMCGLKNEDAFEYLQELERITT